MQILAQRFLIPGCQVLELLNGKRLALNRFCRIIHSFGADVIKRRRAAQAQQAAEKDQPSDDAAADLLSLFMAAKGPDGKPFSDKQLSDAVINFIIAGRDTTAQVRQASVPTSHLQSGCFKFELQEPRLQLAVLALPLALSAWFCVRFYVPQVVHFCNTWSATLPSI